MSKETMLLCRRMTSKKGVVSVLGGLEVRLIVPEEVEDGGNGVMRSVVRGRRVLPETVDDEDSPVVVVLGLMV